MFRRLLPALVVALVLGGALSAAGPVRAQSAAAGDLAAVALSASELPGFTQAQETTPASGVPGISAMFVRTFVSTDASGGAVIDGLIETDQALPAGVIVPLFGGPAFVQALAGGGVNVQNFRVLAPLGLGAADQQVAFDLPDPKDGPTLHFVADIFVRGRVIALVLDGGLQQPDPAQLAAIAQAQDAKLSAAGLG
ncbi:MAG TPA: hypothetical protein VKV26_05465 [Dehalococcoidia bacterium]|nr:hypothetical protein [Dehalococcoidia bacterium]